MTEVSVIAEAKAVRQRVYLGGLMDNVTPEDIEQRFKPFGTISNLCISYDSTGERCRGFAHTTLDTTDKNWQRCVTMLNGAKWKGRKLRVEKAKDDYMKRREAELKAVEVQERTHIRQFKRKALVKHAADMSLVTDRDVEARPGWKRGRYGRAIRVMRLRRPDGSMMVYDPGMYKNNLEKLFGSERPLPVDQLTWFYPEQQQQAEKILKHIDILNMEQPIEQETVERNEFTSREHLSQTSDISSNEFSESENEAMNDVETSTENLSELISEDNLAADNNNNGIIEEESAHVPDVSTSVNELDTSEEKARSLNILKMMFGESTATTAITQSTGASVNSNEASHSNPNGSLDASFNRFLWRDMTQFDPDNPDSFDLLLHSDVPVIPTNDADITVDEESHAYQTTIPTTVMPEVGHDKHYTVKGDLKSMFQLSSQGNTASNDGAQPFKLFGNQSTGMETSNTFSFDFSSMISAPVTPAVQATNRTSSTPAATLPATFFFAHFDQPLLLRRSVYREQNIFTRTGSLEEVTKHWEVMRQGLTQDFKQRHKYAIRMRKRQQGARRSETRH